MTRPTLAPTQPRRDLADGLAFFIDTAPAVERLRDAALAGLRANPKRLSPKFLYDEVGSALFEEITRLPEYYVTRTEVGILTAAAAEIAEAIGPGAAILELGAGASEKVRLLLDAFREPLGFAAVDISGGHLRAALGPLAHDYPELLVGGIAADFTRPFPAPAALFDRACRRLVFLPGSTIGNFPPETIDAVLAAARGLVSPGDALLIGVDLVKDPSILAPAYADAAGVTARFIGNALARLNRSVRADFRLDAFAYDAAWVPDRRRIEMRLVSLEDQTAHVDGAPITFARGEAIEVSHSRKFETAEFAALAGRQGWSAVDSWTDPNAWFAVMLFEAA